VCKFLIVEVSVLVVINPWDPLLSARHCIVSLSQPPA
jgi:hypothetical protein